MVDDLYAAPDLERIEALETKLSGTLSQLGKDSKSKIGSDLMSTEYIQHGAAFDKQGLKNDLTAQIDSTKFSEKKLVASVDKIIKDWGGKLDNKEAHKENILNAAAELAEAQGKIREPRLVAAEKIVNDMMYMLEKQQGLGTRLTGVEQNLITPNPIRGFLEKNGRVKMTTDKLNNIANQLNGYPEQEHTPYTKSVADALNSLSQGNEMNQDSIDYINAKTKLYGGTKESLLSTVTQSGVKKNKISAITQVPKQDSPASEKLKYNAEHTPKAKTDFQKAVKQAKIIASTLKKKTVAAAKLTGQSLGIVKPTRGRQNSGQNKGGSRNI